MALRDLADGVPKISSPRSGKKATCHSRDLTSTWHRSKEHCLPEALQLSPCIVLHLTVLLCPVLSPSAWPGGWDAPVYVKQGSPLGGGWGIS